MKMASFLLRRCQFYSIAFQFHFHWKKTTREMVCVSRGRKTKKKTNKPQKKPKTKEKRGSDGVSRLAAGRTKTLVECGGVATPIRYAAPTCGQRRDGPRPTTTTSISVRSSFVFCFCCCFAGSPSVGFWAAEENFKKSGGNDDFFPKWRRRRVWCSFLFYFSN